MSTPLAWILVANSTNARIFSAQTASSPLIEVESFVHTESRLHDRDITSGLPGKIRSEGGIGGHAFEQPTDPKEHEAINFAHFIAYFLENARIENKFGQLLIMAEPSFLGLLRLQLPEPLKKLVAFELVKNITKHSAADIRAHLPEYLPTL
jgi:protein required for attachment to host cells